MTRRLLLAIGYKRQDINYLAMSHCQVDHTANANAFGRATWIVQPGDYAMMFEPGEIPIRAPETCPDLKYSKRITVHNEDHAVGGKKTAPGHTPGHQILFRELAEFARYLWPATCTICPMKRPAIVCQALTAMPI